MSAEEGRHRGRSRLQALGVLSVCLVVTGCTLNRTTPTVPPWNRPGDPVILAAGDIVTCGGDGHLATLAIVENHPAAIVATLGDTVYEEGSAKQFAECYDPSWGRVKDRTRPAVGGHEYLTPGATGFFDYFRDRLESFGPAAADPYRGWYSYGVGDWHVVVLNSRCEFITGGCTPDSPQLKWLDQDLAAAASGRARGGSSCTLAYWHTPRFSSGRKGNDTEMKVFWDVLAKHGAEIVLNGDNHVYERFAPQDPFGQRDEASGIREFVVGTGGRGHYPFSEGPIQPNSEARNDTALGVLELTLHPGGYEWEFLPVAGETWTDSGSALCH